MSQMRGDYATTAPKLVGFIFVQREDARGLGSGGNVGNSGYDSTNPPKPSPARHPRAWSSDCVLVVLLVPTHTTETRRQFPECGGMEHGPTYERSVPLGCGVVGSGPPHTEKTRWSNTTREGKPRRKGVLRNLGL
ncbi:hypothetical protein, unlikely [Trypanosoma congolense IL3000]|uniref:Uncharacterized protein n=1 Tax=Trypanosoma congolense (strain IL3000) TaxID=1068625 RepID=F9WI99_TRYCI|nr:hypothetical protein, unlikely [Trypanosoma congolense IL3000]